MSPEELPISGLPADVNVTELIHKGNSVAQPDIFLVSSDGQTLVAKDFTGRPLLIRLLFGRRVLRREHRALKKLQDLRGTPATHGLIGRDTLLMEYISGSGPIREARDGEKGSRPPLSFFHSLRDILGEVHRRGIGHGDMRRKNILVRDDGSPCIVDFATAVSTKGRFAPFRSRLFRVVSVADSFALLKLQASYYPDSLTEEEELLVARPPWYLAMARFFRKRVYRGLIKQKRWRARWRHLREKCARIWCRIRGQSRAENPPSEDSDRLPK